MRWKTKEPPKVSAEDKLLLRARQTEQPNLVQLEAGMQPGPSEPKRIFCGPAGDRLDKIIEPAHARGVGKTSACPFTQSRVAGSA